MSCLGCPGRLHHGPSAAEGAGSAFHSRFQQPHPRPGLRTPRAPHTVLSGPGCARTGPLSSVPGAARRGSGRVPQAPGSSPGRGSLGDPGKPLRPPHPEQDESREGYGRKGGGRPVPHTGRTAERAAARRVERAAAAPSGASPVPPVPGTDPAPPHLPPARGRRHQCQQAQHGGCRPVT